MRGYIRCFLWLILFPISAKAQFTTIINVPPDAAPTGISSDTQLNLSDGGVLPEGFQAGAADGTSSEVEVNIAGGIVGENFSANAGSQVFVTGGELGYLSASGGQVAISGGVFRESSQVFATDGGRIYVTGGELSSLSSYGSVTGSDSYLSVSGGTITLVALQPFYGGHAIADVIGGVVQQIIVEPSTELHIYGGEIGSISPVRASPHLPASLTTIDGGEIGTLTLGGHVTHVGEPDTAEFRGGMISTLLTHDEGRVTIFGRRFEVNGVDITSTLTVAESVLIDARDSLLGGVLEDGSPFEFDSRLGGDDSLRGTVKLNLVAVPGDYNGDHRVDAADYAVWRNSLGSQVVKPFAGADGNGNGEVDAGDYHAWRSNYGLAAASSTYPAATVVPEPLPRAMLLTVIAVATSVVGKRKRGS